MLLGRKHGIDPSEVQFVNIGSSGAVFKAVVAGKVDAGVLKTILSEHFGTINAANLRRAHALLESGKAKGKIVLEGF